MTIKLYNRLRDIPGIGLFIHKLPVFATQEYANYLKEVKNYSIIWFHGIVNSNFQFILPFAIKKKFFFKKGIFLTATINLGEIIDLEIEREFLDSIVNCLKKRKLCDWIDQPPNWALFNVVPSNSIYCKFGSYRIDLSSSTEDELLKRIDHGHKRLINKAKKNNVIIKSGPELIEDCARVFSAATFNGNHTLISKEEIKKLLEYLPDIINIYVSYNDTIPQSSLIYCSNRFCLYELYIGLASFSTGGENHLLHWQAIKDAKQNGINYFDFVGARINSLPGSKLDGIQKFKKYFGGKLFEGYLWKMPIAKCKYRFYKISIFIFFIISFRRPPKDLIDQELKNT